MSPIRTSEQINEIAAALAKAQGEFPKIAKNKTGKVRGSTKDGKSYEYSYSYADIADVISAIAPVLSKHGIGYIQPTYLTDTGIFICTRLIHSSGQWMESDYPVSGVTGDHQKMGGAMTYARRYSLCAIVGVAAEEDTDGDGADRVPDLPSRGRQYPARQVATKQIEQLRRDDTPFDDAPPARETDAAAYLREMSEAIKAWTGTAERLKAFWKEEEPNRERAGVTNGTVEYADLFTVFRAKGLQLSGGGDK